MGADIHIFVERRLSKKDPWAIDERHVLEDGELEETSISGRWYMLFGILAGVRGWEEMYHPRGLPQDCDPRIQEKYDSHYHSGTWLTLDEFKKGLLKAYRVSRRDWHKEDDDDIPPTYDDSERGDPFFDYDATHYDDHPGYDSLVNHYHLWRFSKLLDNHMYGTKYQPEVRIVFFFDS